MLERLGVEIFSTPSSSCMGRSIDVKRDDMLGMPRQWFLVSGFSFELLCRRKSSLLSTVRDSERLGSETKNA